MNPLSRRRHILVVDDDQDLRESVAEALEEGGYSVAEAKDGQQALEYLRSPVALPDLIVLDLTMPRMSGAQFRAEQLKSAEHAGIPVALVTAERDGEVTASSLRAAGFMKKPLEIDALLDLVGRILDGQTA